jgi:hypothetical protein
LPGLDVKLPENLQVNIDEIFRRFVLIIVLQKFKGPFFDDSLDWSR